MDGHSNSGKTSAELTIAQQIDDICDDFEKAWQAGKRPKLIEWVQSFDAGHRDDLLKELIPLDIYYRRQAGEQPLTADYQRQFPTLSLAKLETAPRSATDRAEIVPQAELTTQTCSLEATSAEQRIGRFRLIRLLGLGGFGHVWLGFDDQLQRHVAIKVPTPERFQRPEDGEAYLAEARTVAGLDHPNIVPVHDVGRSADGSIYVVSKFIEGGNLAQRIKQGRLPCTETARLLATVAQALHHAHQKRLIHRDIKPANILIEERTGTPYVADFGLAIREEDYLRSGRIAGTPAYMSPEQLRGEGHRLDGRSDIFSTGVMLYEMLTGQRPFRGGTTPELFQQIILVDPAPPRELVGSVPAELERICLKALSKRASDRYATAAELAEDLAHAHQRPQRNQKELQIVPKGLRPFDADAAEFFLELLPGPRNRDGLPESIQFWKTRLEEADADQTFRVGLIYGPSGCGKSSLVKAGLLPRLSADVIAVYLEATPDDTEIRLLRGLRKCLPELPHDLGLVATLAALRRREGPKVVILLDQFEQWLYAHQAGQETELVDALRQCDGGQVQAVVMVRDDFWLAASRFMHDVEVELVQCQNIALVDLFDTDHAQKVLTKFGQAFGKLPAQLESLSAAEKAFLSAVAQGLAQNGKVVSVQLSLFAEMVKGKPWIPATLEQVGGTAGIGVNFLEETFNSRSANPQHRLHQEAARGVLGSLLPEVGSDIKGHMRSQAELLDAAGYQDCPSDFNELLRILDGELRLITPTDPEGLQIESSHDLNSKYYQLTHDYLVASLRVWLTRKQRETRRGRAELRLAERSSLWNVKPENQQLPSLAEFLTIRLWTSAKQWTDPQRKMMRRTRQVLSIRSGLTVTIVAMVIVAGLAIKRQIKDQHGDDYAHALVQLLVAADTPDAEKLIDEVGNYERWATPRLQEIANNPASTAREKLHACLALVTNDPSQVNYLSEQLISAEAEVFPIILRKLTPRQDQLKPRLWELVKIGSAAQRIRAAAALATFDTKYFAWQQSRDDIATALVSVPLVESKPWTDRLRPIGKTLVGPLEIRYRDHQSGGDVERAIAATALADYLRESPSKLIELIVLADTASEFRPLLESLRPQGQAASLELQKWLSQPTPEDHDPSVRDPFWKQQANAAICLLQLGDVEAFWPQLKFTENPSVRSFIIDRLAKFDADRTKLLGHLAKEPDDSIRQALILGLGKFDVTRLAQQERHQVVEQLAMLYLDADPGVHSAVAWTLRKWGEEKRVQELDAELRTAAAQKEQNWFVNSQGQTFAAVNDQEWMVMRHRFAIATHEVTVAQFQKFRTAYHPGREAQTADSPCNNVTWFDAVEYCNWLSKQEGIPPEQWCYEPNEQQRYTEGMKIPADFLERTGYRLPTAAEWECAWRAGTTSSYCYGEPLELLNEYAWLSNNSLSHLWPVGQLAPNSLGLFDVHGNVIEWCHDLRIKQGDDLIVRASYPRKCRGNGWRSSVSYDRSYSTRLDLPELHSDEIGFRVARTRDVLATKPVGPQLPLPEAPFAVAQEAWAKDLGTAVESTNSVGMKMILIPPGEFLTGTATEETVHPFNLFRISSFSVSGCDSLWGLPSRRDDGR